MSNLSYAFAILLFIEATSGAPEQGKFSAKLSNEKTIVGFVKTLYKNSTIRLKITKAKCEDNLQITWLLRSSTCYGEYEAIVGETDPTGSLETIFVDPQNLHDFGSGYYLKSKGEEVECNGDETTHIMIDYSTAKWTQYPKVIPTSSDSKPSDSAKDSKPNDSAKDSKPNDSATGSKRRRRESSEEGTKEGGAENTKDSDPSEDNKPSNDKETAEPKDSNPPEGNKPSNDQKSAPKESHPPQDEPEKTPESSEKKSAPGNSAKASDSAKVDENAIGKDSSEETVQNKNNRIAIVPHMEPYILIVSVDSEDEWSVDVAAEMETPLGYLSAHDYPLKTFYMIMCIVYSLYAATWLVMSACNFRDLLRVQFWVGGVILLGMIEKAVFYSEYLTINTTGVSVMGAVKFAEVVSALKRSLARMLVIIVSLGFGIVKPRLGPMLHRVIGIGILYFILAIIEALVRNDASSHPGNNNQIFAAIPLAIIDSIICWWIFMSLMQTMKTLRLRRNVVKLSLYRHFSNTIIFCVIASLAMIAYSFRYRNACETAWKEKWVYEVFWHILFSIILLVIMVLWRPNVNNQRYAFSPLLDADAEEGAEEPMLGSGATETVKMRGLKNVSERRDPASNAEENLKWIEDNIPETIADAALPAIMDSDEEIVASKYEMSKME